MAQGSPFELELRAYLQEGRDSRVRESEKLDKVVDAVTRLTTEHQMMRLSFENKLELVQHQIAGMNARISELEKDQEVTGNGRLEALNVRIAEERDFRKNVTKIALSAVGTILTLGVGGIGTVLWYLLTKKP